MAELAVDEGSTTRGGEEKDVDGGEETVPALARESSAEVAFYRDFWRLRLTRPVKAGTKKTLTTCTSASSSCSIWTTT